MIKQKENFELLVGKASSYLQKELKYSKKTSGNHERHWRLIGRFMRKRRMKDYREDVGNRVLRDRFGNRSLLRHEKEFYNSVQMLNEFLVTRKITVLPRMERRYQTFKNVWHLRRHM